MILKGSQRAGAAQLAAHLLNERDNDHVAVHELRGFVGENLRQALHESQAIAVGTRCKQFLFSLSLNPPKDTVLSAEAFERAADACEKCLGLEGQPRAIVIHEKEGRRHAHVVWSRIDSAQMRAVNMSHFKLKLTALSKELYLEHDWDLPEGLRHMGGKSPLNFTLEEWQQAKHARLDPREIKQVFQQAYQQADSLKALAAALAERGYFIAKGDRRGIVATDIDGNVYSLPRYIGVKTKAFRERFGDGQDLPGLDQVSADLNKRLTAKLKSYATEERERQKGELEPLKRRAAQLTAEQRQERVHLAERQSARQRDETAARARKLRTGLVGLWDKITGRAAGLRQQNQLNAWECAKRDAAQRDALIRAQMDERRKVQSRIEKMRLRHIEERRDLHREIMRRAASRDPDRNLMLKAERQHGLSFDR